LHFLLRATKLRLSYLSDRLRAAIKLDSWATEFDSVATITGICNSELQYYRVSVLGVRVQPEAGEPEGSTPLVSSKLANSSLW